MVRRNLIAIHSTSIASFNSDLLEQFGLLRQNIGALQNRTPRAIAFWMICSMFGVAAFYLKLACATPLLNLPLI